MSYNPRKRKRECYESMEYNLPTTFSPYMVNLPSIPTNTQDEIQKEINCLTQKISELEAFIILLNVEITKIRKLEYYYNELTKQNSLILQNQKKMQEDIKELNNQNVEILLELAKKENRNNLEHNSEFMSYIN